MKIETPEETSQSSIVTSGDDDDGYFTSIVSVQHHQKTDVDNPLWKKVVWPAESSSDTRTSTPDQVERHHKRIIINPKSILEEDKRPSEEEEKPYGWIQQVSDGHHASQKSWEMEIQKRTFDVHHSHNRSRSKMRSNEIVERARSFERGKDRQNVPSRRKRSPSLKRREQIDEMWKGRPESRGPEEDGRKRWNSVGRINTSAWEDRIRNESPAPIVQPDGRRRRHLTNEAPSPPPRIDSKKGHSQPQGVPIHDKDQSVQDWIQKSHASMKQKEYEQSRAVKQRETKSETKERRKREVRNQSSKRSHDKDDSDLPDKEEELMKIETERRLQELAVASRSEELKRKEAELKAKETDALMKKEEKRRLEDLKKLDASKEEEERKIFERLQLHEQNLKKQQEEHKKLLILEQRLREERQQIHQEEEYILYEQNSQEEKQTLLKQNEKLKQLQEEERLQREGMKKQEEEFRLKKQRDQDRIHYEERERAKQEERIRRLQEEEWIRKMQEEEARTKRLHEEDRVRKLKEERIRKSQDERMKRLQEEERARRLLEEERLKILHEEEKLKALKEQSERLKKMKEEDDQLWRMREEEKILIKKREEKERYLRKKEEEKLQKLKDEELKVQRQDEETRRKLKEEKATSKMQEHENFKGVTKMTEEERLMKESLKTRDLSLGRDNYQSAQHTKNTSQYEMQNREEFYGTQTSHHQSSTEIRKPGEFEGIPQKPTRYRSRDNFCKAELPEERQRATTPLDIKTGFVNNKRELFNRSQSCERSLKSEGNTDRRRYRSSRFHDWKKVSFENDQPQRPGSALGHSSGSVKNSVEHWNNLDKAQSITTLFDTSQSRSRSQSRCQDWIHAKDRSPTPTRFDQVETNQVRDTVNVWGSGKSESGRNTPLPSRTIGETFSDSKIGLNDWKAYENENGEAPWRVETPEPNLQLINVSVSRKIPARSESVKKEKIANDKKEEIMMQNLHSQTKSISNTSAVFALEKTSERLTETEHRVQEAFRKDEQNMRGTHMQSRNLSGLQREHAEEILKAEENHKRAQTKKQGDKNLPMPVSNSWYHASGPQGHILSQTSSSSTLAQLEGLKSPTETGKTPLPVLAGWYDSDKEKSTHDLTTTLNVSNRENDESSGYITFSHENTKDEPVVERYESDIEKRQRELEEIKALRARTRRARDVFGMQDTSFEEEDDEEIKFYEENTTKRDYRAPQDGRPTPTRRIGNLFNRSADLWSDKDETDIARPLPPPRDSSRDYMIGRKNNNKS